MSTFKIRETVVALVAPIMVAATTVQVAAQDTNNVVRLLHQHADAHNRDPRMAMFDICAKRLGLTIEENMIPAKQYQVLLPIQLSSDNPPDIYGHFPGSRAQFQAEHGNIHALGEHWGEIKDRLWPGVQEVATEPDGNVYTVPYSMLPNTFWYNVKVFEEHGVEIPETWDEMLAAAEKLKAAGITPFVIGTKLAWEPLFWFDYIMLRTAGSEFRSRLMAGEESYLDPRVIRTMEIWADIVNKGYFNTKISAMGWREMAAEVIDGNAAMELMGPWTTTIYKSANLTPTVDYGIFPFPVIDEGVPDAVEGVVQSFSLSGKGKNTEAAIELTKCITDSEPQTVFAAESQELAANRNVSLDVYKTDEAQAFVKIYYDMLDAPFHQNLEQAAHRGVIEVAKREFSRFFAYPDQYMEILQKLEDQRLEEHDQ